MLKPNSSWQNWQKSKKSSYVKKRSIKPLVDFSGGEVVFNPLSLVIREVKRIKPADLSLYPDSNCSLLKKAIASRFKVKENIVAVGNGSDELIENISRIFIEKGNKILVVTPTFFRFIDAGVKAGGQIVAINTSDLGFKFSSQVIDRILMAIKRHQPKIIWLSSPNNPTGELINKESIVKIVKNSQGLVVVDEAYMELADTENKQSTINFVSQFNNLIVLKTLSKAYGLAGIRFGFVIGPATIVHILENWRLIFDIGGIAQKIIPVALGDVESLKSARSKLIQEKEWLFQRLKKIKTLEFTTDTKTNLFLIRHKSKDIFEGLLKSNILTADFRNQMGIEGQGWVRVNIKTRKENKVLLKSLKVINKL